MITDNQPATEPKTIQYWITERDEIVAAGTKIDIFIGGRIIEGLNKLGADAKSEIKKTLDLLYPLAKDFDCRVDFAEEYYNYGHNYYALKLLKELEETAKTTGDFCSLAKRYDYIYGNRNQMDAKRNMRKAITRVKDMKDWHLCCAFCGYMCGFDGVPPYERLSGNG